MSIVSRLIIVFTVFSLSFSCMLRALAQTDPAPSAKSAILIEASQNTVIYEKNADCKLPMASTTKIMTAITALEYFSSDASMTVPNEAVGTEGTSASLEAGEVYSLHDLLIALMLQSGNDAAVTIAINVAGTVERFAVLMNRTARNMGLTSTSFKNPHGLPAEDHYTTARELAIITSHALKSKPLADIVATQRAKICSDSGKVRQFRNHNKLLMLYEGANGVKTGYTKASGRCLVSSATKNGQTLIAVTLNSHNDWNEHTAMLDYGFSVYQKQKQ